jgi:hypothetical protein
MIRRPSFDDIRKRVSTCYEVNCRCGTILPAPLRFHYELYDHWERGHFDLDDREFIDSVALDPGPSVGPLREILDEIRSGVTALEVEVNRFELSRDASNDDVAKAVTVVIDDLLIALTRLGLTVHKIANHGEHQFKRSNGL